MKNQIENRFAKSSLISIILTAIATSVHHYYEIGFFVLILIAIFIVLPSLLMFWFKNTGKKIYLWIYGFLSIWLVFAFGFIDGLWNHTLKNLGSGINSLVMSFHGSVHSIGASIVETDLAGNYIYQGTGMLTFIAAIFAAYYGYRFIKEENRMKSITN